MYQPKFQYVQGAKSSLHGFTHLTGRKRGAAIAEYVGYTDPVYTYAADQTPALDNFEFAYQVKASVS